MMPGTFLNMPYALAHGEGQRTLSLGRLHVVVKASSEQTGGAFNLFEAVCPPGFATPLHIHYAEDVAVFVLHGRLAFSRGNELHEVHAGAFLYQPRGTPHGFRVDGDSAARLLYLTTPARFDRFVLEHQLTFQQAIEERAARYKIEILEPLSRQTNSNTRR